MNLCKCGCGLKTHKEYYQKHRPKNNLCLCGCGEYCVNKYVSHHNLEKRPKKEKENGNICLCGCGQITKLNKSKYLSGHYSKTEKHKKYISGINTGKIFSEQTKQIWSNQRKGNTHLLGHKHTEQTKEKMREKRKGRTPAKGFKPSQEYKDRMAIISSNNLTKLGGRKHIYYKNNIIIFMRSGWEIKYAKWLDENNYTWDYESCLFKLSNNRYYCPDFYIWDLDEYHEVKGIMFNKSRIKLDLFKKDFDDVKLKIIDENILKLLKIKLWP